VSTRPEDPADPAAAGMKKGLTSYGDPGFSLFLRKAFIKGAGYTDAALDRPVVAPGIAIPIAHPARVPSTRTAGH